MYKPGFTKWVSMFMAMTMFALTILMGVHEAIAGGKSNKIKKELVELRTQHSKTFVNEKKQYILEEYLEPIHFKQNGHWIDIDNTITGIAPSKAMESDLLLENKANRYRVGFAKNSKANKLVRLKLGESHIDFRLLKDTNASKAVTSKNKVAYQNVYDDVDLIYYADNTGIKEEWVLHKYNGNNTLRLHMNLKNVKPKQKKDGSIDFVDKKGAAVFTIPRPFMIDSQSRVSENVKYKITVEGKETYLDLVMDEAWLKNSERSYPVTVDPSLIIQGAAKTFDSFVGQAQPDSNFGYRTYLTTGNNPDHGISRSFVKFDLDPILSGAKITSAKLSLYQTNSSTHTVKLHTYPVKENWSSTTVTWNNQPSTGNSIANNSITGAGWYDLYMTQLVRDWYSGTTPNHGVMLRLENEANDRKSYYSSDYTTNTSLRPKLTIVYEIEPIGDESFWTTASDLVNTFNGNLFLSETDVELKGRGEVSLTVGRSYNSRSGAIGLFGRGWISPIEQNITDSGSGPLLYVDEDGTPHSFAPNGDGTYRSPGGVNLTLVKNSDQTYTITDADQNQIYFSSAGKLTSIQDPVGNKVTIAYTDGVPTTMTDPSGRVISFTYNSGGRISKVSYPSGRTIEYTYNVDKLVQVVEKDADASVISTVTYSYDVNNRLNGITDAKGIKRSFVYDDQNRLIEESHPITVNGVVETATTSIAYAGDVTTVTNPAGVKTTFKHNEYGNVIERVQDAGTGRLNLKNTFNYDGANKLVSQKDPKENAAGTTGEYQYTYDQNGNMNSETTPNGDKASVQFDEEGNLQKTTDPKGNTETTEHDEHGNDTSSTDTAQKSSAKKFDQYGNVIAETAEMSPGNNLVDNSSFEIDKDGNNWPDGWSTVPASTSAITWDSAGLTVNGVTLGNKSIKITNPTTTLAVASKRIPYDPNKTYVFSGYVKTANATGQGTIYAFGFNSATGTYKAIKSASITGNQDTTRLHIIVHPGDFPSGTNEIELRGYVSPGGQTGEYWFDGMQVEAGYYGGYNLVLNSSFEHDTNQDTIPDRWYMSAETGPMDGMDSIAHDGSSSGTLVGEADKWKSFFQDVYVKGNAGSEFTLSGFSKVQNPNPSGGIYGYIVKTYQSGSEQETFTFHFDKKESHDWQHIAESIKTTKPFDKIRVYYEYALQSGQAWFDTTKLMVGNITTTKVYDANGYEEAITDPNGRRVEYTHDVLGNKTSETTGGDTTLYDYNSQDQVKSITDAQGNVTQYEYDSMGKITKTIDANNHSTTYEYNEMGKLTQITDASGQLLKYGYNILGNPTRIEKPTGDKVEYDYDAVGRIKTITINGVPSYAYEYDENGNVTKETNLVTNQSLSYTHDKNNRLISKTEPNGQKTEYSYDKNGNITQTKITSGTQIITQDHTFNELNLTTKVTENGDVRAQASYEERNGLSSLKKGDQTITLYEYDGSGAISRLLIHDDTGNVIRNYAYSYDTKGRVQSVTIGQGTIRYSYDSLDQLIKEEYPDGTIIAYTYDKMGNRLTKTTTKSGTSQTINYTYNEVNELTTVDGVAYTYDQTGNLTKDDKFIYEYDGDNRLSAVKDFSGNTVASFTYLANGLRKTMTTDQGTITFHYDPNQRISYETDQNGNVVASYTYIGDVHTPVSMTRNGQIFYFQTNGHGDVVAVTDASGNEVASYEYDAFGNVTKETGTVENPYRLAGYRYDSVTGLYYLQQRYYNPKTGRFLNRDSETEIRVSDPLSLNTYLYTYNNPVMSTDRTGQHHYSNPPAYYIPYYISNKTLGLTNGAAGGWALLKAQLGKAKPGWGTIVTFAASFAAMGYAGDRGIIIAIPYYKMTVKERRVQYYWVKRWYYKWRMVWWWHWHWHWHVKIYWWWGWRVYWYKHYYRVWHFYWKKVWYYRWVRKKRYYYVTRNYYTWGLKDLKIIPWN